MQLILDADNIDIQRNMSTIEQEPLNEKFLTDKVINHLADDIHNGNKENIQKQQNIILDVGEDNVNDTDKEMPSSRAEILTNNCNVEKSHKDAVDMPTSEVINDDENIKNTPDLQLEQVPDTSIIIDENKEESLSEQNEVKLKESIYTGVNVTESESEKNKGDLAILDKDLNTDVSEKQKESDIMEITTERNEEDKNELDKEVDISELSSELNEEKEMDLDKEVDITEVSTELSKELEIEMDETIDTVTEDKSENNLITVREDKSEDNSITVTEDKSEDNSITVTEDKSEDNSITVTEDKSEDNSMQIEVPITNPPDKTRESKGSEKVCSYNTDTNEKSDAIEIDDEDDKISEQNSQSAQNIQDVQENLDKNNEVELVNDSEKSSQEDATVTKVTEETEQPKRICRLSNNLDIFSDEEDDHPDEEIPKDDIEPETEKQCINIDDDDDIMLIDEDSGTKDNKNKDTNLEVDNATIDSSNIQLVPDDDAQPKNEINVPVEGKPVTETIETIEEPSITENKDTIAPVNKTEDTPVIETNKMAVDKHEEKEKIKTPLLPKNFVNTCKKNLSDMTRNDLEEFCILKIVESIVDRSNLGEIKTHLKNLTQTMEECKKKCLMLSKQNKDLQVVLKSVQEEQKSGSDVHITPLKITRSVGMQVMMISEKTHTRRKPVNGVGPQTTVPNTNTSTKQAKTQQTPNTRNQKEKVSGNQQIPVPRLVPATPPAVKTNQTNTNNAATKQSNNTALPNGMRNSPPVPKVAEKRARSQAVTVDLTDDEPPAKLQNVQRGPVNQPMRVLTAAPNLVPTQRFPQGMNSPRKVYIPISGPQAQNVRPGQTVILKALSGLGPRPRAAAQSLFAKPPPAQTAVRFGRGQSNRHPAPLPDAVRQCQPPNWKSLPPAPDLKLSKVENGIVISWKIDGYQEDNHEEIASYQLYAYQETSSPPNTALWKKIGDVKALPLPMACTLTQFMAGYKYYFAVRAVDIRSRFGPFSLPGSILLLNKM